MARLIGPADRLVYLFTGARAGQAQAQGLTGYLFADEAATTAADVLHLDGSPVPAGVVQIDGYSQWPEVQYPNGVNTIYGRVGLTGPVVALHANSDSRLDLIERRAGLLRAVDDRYYRTVLGVLRNDGAATNYWQPIDDVGHRPHNIASVSTSTTSISVVYSTSFTVERVCSFIVTPDDGLARAGVVVGASVGFTAAVLFLAAPTVLADYVYYNGTSWVSTDNVFTPSFSAGVLTLTHPTIAATHDQTGGTSEHDLNVTGRGGVLMPLVSETTSPATDTGIKISFYDWSGVLQTVASTDMKVYVSRASRKPRQLNPQLLDTVVAPGTNLWILGVFEPVTA